MTRKDRSMGRLKMEELIARVEAATEGSRELDMLIYQQFHPDQPFMTDGGSVRHPVQDATFAPLSTIKLSGWEDPNDLALAVGAPRYTASLDAALTLVPEGFYWEVAHGHIASGKGPYWASCYNDEMLDRMLDGDADIPAATPALALCAAALRARAAQGNEAAKPARQLVGSTEGESPVPKECAQPSPGRTPQ